MNRIAATAIASLAILTACSSADDTATTSTGDTLAMTVGPATDSVAPAATTGLLDPNSASQEQIAALPGMTPALADSIVARRPLTSMVAVDSILGRSLSEAQRDTIYARMFTPIALNTASDAEILLIPGIGSRMLREFKEYRPYDNIARFRREMGKYVDSTEVARMEQYVKVD
jgi:DNA uptake protein ComE-like DNA-binding protein